MPIFKIKFKTELVSKLKSTIISVAISKKGPYGITLSLLLKYKINDKTRFYGAKTEPTRKEAKVQLRYKYQELEDLLKEYR